LKRKRTLLAVVGLLLSCSAERGARMAGGLDGGLDEGMDDGAAPVRGAHDAPGVDVLVVVDALARGEVSAAAVVDAAPFEALWQLPKCPVLNNWPAGDPCIRNGGPVLLNLPGLEKGLKCYVAPMSPAQPCYSPEVRTDGATGYVALVRVNSCEECVP